jgi:hypothetical protein
VYRD